MKPTQPPSSTDTGTSSTQPSDSSFKKLLIMMVARALIVFLAGLLAVVYAVHRHPQTVPAHQGIPSVPPPTATPPKPASTSKPELADLEFPKKFFFGSAYSDFQTAGISETSDWYDYVNSFKPPQVGPGIANDLFHRYKEDFDAASQIGIQVHRISLEWSRIEPQEGVWDRNVVKQYRDIFRYMKRRGIEPMICLNHFPLPQWFTDDGGWENPQAPDYYASYASFVAKEIGIPLKIHWWLTFNEPQFSVLIPYGKGDWPPYKTVEGLQDTAGINRFFVVGSRILDGHRMAYRAIHGVMDRHVKNVAVGFASATGTFYPADPNSPLDRMASNAYNVFYGTLLDYAVGRSDRDFIGINYYGRSRLKLHMSVGQQIKAWLTDDKPFVIEWLNERSNQKDARPKEFYPDGLYDLITRFKVLGLPIVVTENGIDDNSDHYREEFITIHLKAILDAIRDGANVIGYQYWALTDTWEPGDGRFSQMGLVKIDRDNDLQRSIRPSARTYADIIKTHTLSKELQQKYRTSLPVK